MVDTRASVWPLVVETQLAVGHRLYMLALMGSLALPSILSALETENGQSTGDTYKAWLMQHGAATENGADLIYGLRCSLLHQGSAYPHRAEVRAAFRWPEGPLILHGYDTVSEAGDVVAWFDIPTFVEDMAKDVDRWLNQYGALPLVQKNVERFARFRPEGLPGHTPPGVPVIA